jgi:hypothetical protein
VVRPHFLARAGSVVARYAILAHQNPVRDRRRRARRRTPTGREVLLQAHELAGHEQVIAGDEYMTLPAARCTACM